ncbi:MAG: hypothetical protein L0207_01170 [Chlamydiae bacterium]|nr:hypothetical protein [Chlamydiota bacterium]
MMAPGITEFNFGELLNAIDEHKSNSILCENLAKINKKMALESDVQTIHGLYFQTLCKYGSDTLRTKQLSDRDLELMTVDELISTYIDPKKEDSETISLMPANSWWKERNYMTYVFLQYCCKGKALLLKNFKDIYKSVDKKEDLDRFLKEFKDYDYYKKIETVEYNADMQKCKFNELPFEMIYLDNLKIFSMPNNELTHLPENSPECLEEINLKGNKLTEIKFATNKKDPVYSYRLKKLDLSNNKIDNVTKGIFDRCPSLIELDLSGNPWMTDEEFLIAFYNHKNMTLILDLNQFKTKAVNYLNQLPANNNKSYSGMILDVIFRVYRYFLSFIFSNKQEIAKGMTLEEVLQLKVENPKNVRISISSSAVMGPYQIKISDVQNQ